MSNWKWHLGWGMAWSVLVMSALLYFGYTADWLTYISFFLLAALYSLLPDIDSQASKIRMLVTLIGLFLTIGAVILNERTIAIMLLIALIGVWAMSLIPGLQHRGFMHTGTAGVLASAVLFFIDPLLFFISLTCYILHLFVDYISTKLGGQQE